MSASRQKKIDSFFSLKSPSERELQSTSKASGQPESTERTSNADVSSSATQQTVTTLDIGNFKPGDDQTKYDFLTNHWKPPQNYKFPVSERKVKGTVSNLSFQRGWMEIFPWLAYSPSANGAFCVHCRLLAGETAGGNKLGQFVKTPMRNLKDARKLCADHASKEYHLTATLRSENFKNAHESGSVADKISTSWKQQASLNRQALASIIQTIKFCGRQNIPLRGHRDYGPLFQIDDFETAQNEGNLRALLRYCYR